MSLPRGSIGLAVALALALGGCGDGAGSGSAPTTSVDTNPTASAPAATAPPPDATQPGTDPVAPPPGTTEPGAGDEEPVRVPAGFAVRDGVLRPRSIVVPPFLAVELSLTSADGDPHRLVLRTARPRTLAVGAGERAAVQIPGLRAGRYVVELDGRRAGVLVAGGEVGP